MTVKLRILAAAALAFALGTAAASAASVSVIDSDPQGGSNGAGITFAVGYSGFTPGGATWSSNPLVTPPPGNVGGIYQSPFNSNGLTGSQSYFSVGAESGVNGALSPVTLTLGSAVNIFRILWGSIDTYNTISFYDGDAGAGSLLGTYTGTQIATLLGLAVGPTNYEHVVLLSFGDFGGALKSIKFQSSSAAFEFALAPVPVPAALPLFGTALGAMALLRYRRKRGITSTFAA
jgi:hypothetical protein